MRQKGWHVLGTATMWNNTDTETTDSLAMEGTRGQHRQVPHTRKGRERAGGMDSTELDIPARCSLSTLIPVSDASMVAQAWHWCFILSSPLATEALVHHQILLIGHCKVVGTPLLTRLNVLGDTVYARTLYSLLYSQNTSRNQNELSPLIKFTATTALQMILLSHSDDTDPLGLVQTHPSGSLCDASVRRSFQLQT